MCLDVSRVAGMHRATLMCKVWKILVGGRRTHVYMTGRMSLRIRYDAGFGSQSIGVKVLRSISYVLCIMHYVYTLCSIR